MHSIQVILLDIKCDAAALALTGTEPPRPQPRSATPIRLNMPSYHIAVAICFHRDAVDAQAEPASEEFTRLYKSNKNRGIVLNGTTSAEDESVAAVFNEILNIAIEHIHVDIAPEASIHDRRRRWDGQKGTDLNLVQRGCSCQDAVTRRARLVELL